jgi:hypothetical protein
VLAHYTNVRLARIKMSEYTRYITLKSAIEDLFGEDAWYALKESPHLPTWRKYASKTLQAIEFSIKDTVEIYDDDWMREVETSISRGLEGIKAQKSIDEVVAVLAATLVRISFLQIGLAPMRRGTSRAYPLKKGKWNLSAYRQVVYLQTRTQKENYFMDGQRRKIGLDKQMELVREYKSSSSELTFAEWCFENGKA